MRAAAALIVALGAPAVRSELVPLEAAHVATLLDGHNAARCAVGVADLAWSDADAASAAVWAAGCVYEHSTPAERGARGENMAAAAGVGFPAVLDTANRGWIDEERPNWPCATGEIPNCEPVPGATNPQCGHYTQVVWAGSTTVGCAHALCTENNPFSAAGEWRFTVCQFSGAGNMMGARPFPIEQCEGASTCDAAGATPTPTPTATPTPTPTPMPETTTPETAATPTGASASAAGADAAVGVEESNEALPSDSLLIGGIIAVALAFVAAGVVVYVRRRRSSQAALSTKGGDEDLEAWGENVFTTMDADSSGGLDKQEMLKACAQRGLAVDQSFLDGLWDVLDKDGSGDLQLGEFKHALTVIESKKDFHDGTVTAAMEGQAAVAPSPSQGLALAPPPDLSLIELAPPPLAATATSSMPAPALAPPDLSLIELETPTRSAAAVAPPDLSQIVVEPVASSQPASARRADRALPKLPPPSLGDARGKGRPPPQLPESRPQPALPPRGARPQPALPPTRI